MRPYYIEMTTRGFLITVVLGCAFWALVIYHDVQARGASPADLLCPLMSHCMAWLL